MIGHWTLIIYCVLFTTYSLCTKIKIKKLFSPPNSPLNFNQEFFESPFIYSNLSGGGGGVYMFSLGFLWELHILLNKHATVG